jgi:hypothetical protein
MHRSRIDGIFIDHPPQSFEASVAFWAAATGRTPGSTDDPTDPYRSFGSFAGDVIIDVQRVGDTTAPRIHLDIATDDVDAEAQRLEQLGASRLQRFDRYWQMRDPGGLVFCVIPPHTDDFLENATTWP